MAIEWNRYLARYQQERGGYFFGNGDSCWDGYLVLAEGEKTPLLVWFDTEFTGGSSRDVLRARTMVWLDGEYTLHIRAKSVVGAGVQNVMGLVGGDMEFGYPEATRGRIITTNSPAFTKLVLGDLALRNALAMREKDSIQVGEAPQSGGWHRIEVNAGDVFGTIGGASPWINEAMAADTLYMDPEDKEALLQAGSRCFNTQMDGLLGLLRAARDGVTMWPMPKTT